MIGVPNEDLGEKARAVVQFADPAAALIGYYWERMAHFKCPRTVDFVDQLPRYPTG